MSRLLSACIWIGIVGAAARGAAPPMSPVGKPVLLYKGKDCFIHAVPAAAYAAFIQLRPGVGSAKETMTGMTVLFTSTKTGQMKRLFTASQTRWSPGAFGWVGYHVIEKGAGGIALDSNRIYLLNWSGTFGIETMFFSGKLDLDHPVEKAKYTLEVFRLSDGARIHELHLTGRGVPKRAGGPITNAGPLKVIDGGVSCFGKVFLFKGDKLLQRKE